MLNNSEIPHLNFVVANENLGHCKVGSLTGAVSSQRVTEEHEGKLKLVGNQL